MQVNPEDSPPDIYATWSNPRMTDFENWDKWVINWEEEEGHPSSK